MSYVYKAQEGEVREGTAGAETTIALAKGITISVATGHESVYEIGSRRPAEHKRGNEEITGTIEKLFFDNRFLAKVKADYPSDVNIIAYATGDGKFFRIVCSGVVFTSFSFDMPAEDYVTESVDFQAKSIDITFVS